MSAPVIALLLLACAVVIGPGRVGPRVRLVASCRPERATRTGDHVPPGHGRLLPACCGSAVALLVAVLTGMPLAVVLAPAAGMAGYLGARRLLLGHGRPPPVAPLDLAATWDLLGACLSAGLPAPAAVRAITPHLPEPAAGALRHSAELLALGADPVGGWEPALRLPETAPLARAARRSARAGTALAGAAAALAAEVRAEATDAAEAQAQRAAVLVSGPLALCFLPAFLCLGIVPVVLGLASRLSLSW